jgi:hypothetical protein
VSHNPYLPPAATVEDVNKAAIGRRPVTVGIAVLLLTLGLLYSASGFIRLLAYFQTGVVSAVFLVWSLARLAIVTLVCVQLWRGRNWARVLLGILTALSLLTLVAQLWSFTHLPASVDLPRDTAALAPMLIAPLINLTAVFLVYVPGRAWFRRGAR